MANATGFLSQEQYGDCDRISIARTIWGMRQIPLPEQYGECNRISIARTVWGMRQNFHRKNSMKNAADFPSKKSMGIAYL
jgi:hypothetical protein